MLTVIALIITLNPLSQPSPQDKAAAMKAYEEGGKLSSEKQYDKAIAAYTYAISLDPAFQEAYFSRSQINGTRPDFENRKLDLAIADLSRVLQLSPGDYSALFNRAGYYRQLKQDDNAIRDYSEIIDGPTDFSGQSKGKDACLAQTRFYRGRVYLLGKKNADLAIKDLSEAVRLNPNINDAVIYYRARAYLLKKEYIKSRADFITQLKTRPDDVVVLTEGAWLLATCPNTECRDGKTAVEWARKALKLTDGKDPEVSNALAAALAEIGQFAEAAEQQKLAIKQLGMGPAPQIKEMEARLAKYLAKKPYRDE